MLKKAQKILHKHKCEVLNTPQNQKLITVITPTYNSEKFLNKTINSVIDQSIGFDKLQLILIDDCSSDNTKKIIKEFTQKYNNICGIFLFENTGTPATPRNIGIELANSKYITFLDADDWLDSNGLKILYNILEETNDDFAVGRTVKVESNSIGYIGEFYTHTERKSISAFDEPMIFYHGGPPARLMKLSLLNENNIRFPEMQFNEDKIFFIEVLLHANKISITNKPIYYVNRTKENNTSLTKSIDTLDKRKSDLEVIKYLKKKKLPVEKEKVLLNRIYEYDFLRTFDSKMFANLEDKEPYLALYKKVMKTTKNLRYDFKNEIKKPLYHLATNLYLEGYINQFIRLFQWSKLDTNKKIVIKDDKLPYYELPFLEGNEKNVRIPMYAESKDVKVKDDIYYQTVNVYGDYLDNINCILIRNRKNAMKEIKLEYELIGNELTFKVDAKTLLSFEDGLISIYIQYNNYKLLTIRNNVKTDIHYKDKLIEFYPTKFGNLEISIK